MKAELIKITDAIALCILLLAAGCADASNMIEGRASVIDPSCA